MFTENAFHGSWARQRGFTIVELMVVIAIIVIAAGFMTPSITDFLHNRQLENVRGQFGSTFNQARLRAVNQRAKVSLVFFRDGVRIYDVGEKIFVDEYFNPDTSPLASEDVWYEFGFLGGADNDAHSWNLPRYRAWEENQLQLQNSRNRGREARMEFRVDQLPRVTFQRDGTLVFDVGVDVSSTEFKKDADTIGTTDVVIKQKSNMTWCYLDFRNTGQLKSKSLPMGEFPKPPTARGKDEKKDKR